MTKYISLEFEEDLHRDDVDRFKRIRNCVGVSSYRNTLNMYFKTIDRQTLLHLALLLQEQYISSGGTVMLGRSTLEPTYTPQAIYTALREEAEI